LDASKASKGYPYGDAAATEFCKKGRSSEHERQAAATAFIGSLLEQIASRPVSEGVEPSKFWRTWGVPEGEDYVTRSTFFEIACDAANKWLEEHQLVVRAMEQNNMTLRDVSETLYHSCCHQHAVRLAKRIEEAGVKIPCELDATAQAYYKKTPTFFLGFDESSLLNESDDGISLMHLRRTVIAFTSENSPLRLWAVLIDTYSGITELSGPLEPSDRLQENYAPLPPFVTLPFDVFKQKDNTATRVPDLLLMSRLKLFGRPVSPSRLFCDIHVYRISVVDHTFLFLLRPI
jgi:hypothetical protein